MTDPVDELLADLRTDVPEMSEAAFEAGRARLQAIVAPSLVLIEPEPDTAAVPIRKKRLLRSPPRRLVAAAAAVAVLAAGVLAGQTLWSGGTAPVASAAVQLSAAADEINPTDKPIRPDQYRYVVVHIWGLRGPGLEQDMMVPPELRDTKVLVSEEWRSEIWTPADPDLECTTRSGPTGRHKWVVGDEETAKKIHFTPSPRRSEELTEPCDQGGEGWWGAPNAAFLASLPRDPVQLYDRLRHENFGIFDDRDPDLAILAAVTQLLGSGLVPADLRAALYRALAKLPGLKVTEQVANLDGKTGTAFGLIRAGQRTDMIIDPANGQYIGSRAISQFGHHAEAEVPPGTVLGSSSVSNPVVVDKVGDTH